MHHHKQRGTPLGIRTGEGTTANAVAGPGQSDQASCGRDAFPAARVAEWCARTWQAALEPAMRTRKLEPRRQANGFVSKNSVTSSTARRAFSRWPGGQAPPETCNRIEQPPPRSDLRPAGIWATSMSPTLQATRQTASHHLPLDGTLDRRRGVLRISPGRKICKTDSR